MKETIINLKKVYRYGSKYRVNLIITIFLSIIFCAMNILFPILTAKQLVSLSNNIYMELFIVSLFILGFDLLSAINHLILNRNTQKFFRGTTKNIQLDTAKEILKIELSDIDKSSTGTFIQRINNDTDEMSRVFTRGMGYLNSILTNIGIFVAVFIISKEVFLFYFICTSILIIIHLYKVKSVNEEDKKYRKQREKTTGLISELVRGVRDIKMLNAKDSFVNEIESNIDDLTKSQFSMRNIDANYDCFIFSLSGIISFLLIMLLIHQLSNGLMTVSVALILYSYKPRILTNLMAGVGNLLTEIKGFNLSSNRVFSLLESNEFSKEKFGKTHIDKVKGNIEFKDVCFSYHKNMVLNNLNFKVDQNEIVAFVGKSGSGKTTIFSLLCKLYSINSGKIILDGKDINILDEDSIRNNITIINQNPYIFNLSIKDNLKLVKENLSDKEIIEACKKACLDEFIDSLPEKYNTVVGEGGVTLSGGQRQRLAIARAFVQDSKIILFDEATSALDNETQSYIQQAINNLKDKCTILIIAHRLSTIVNSNRIMLVENGSIIGSGTHNELLKNNIKYKKLYENELIEN